MEPTKYDRTKLRVEEKQLIEEAPLFRKLNFNRYQPILFYWKNNKDSKVDDLIVNQNKQELQNNFNSYIDRLCSLQLQSLQGQSTFQIYGMITQTSQQLIDFLYYVQINSHIYGFMSLLSAFAEQQTRSETVMVSFIQLLKYFSISISSFNSCQEFLNEYVDIQEQQALLQQFFSPIYQKEIEKQLLQRQYGSAYNSQLLNSAVFQPLTGDSLFKFMFNFYSHYGRKCRNQNMTASVLKQFLQDSQRQHQRVDQETFNNIYERVVRTIFKDCYRKIGLKPQQQLKLLDKLQQMLEAINKLIQSDDIDKLIKDRKIRQALNISSLNEADVKTQINNFKEQLNQCYTQDDLYTCFENLMKSKCVLEPLINCGKKLKLTY